MPPEPLSLLLAGRARRLGRLGAVALAGGVVGAALLLVTPAEAFALLVPWLIGLAGPGLATIPAAVYYR